MAGRLDMRGERGKGSKKVSINQKRSLVEPKWLSLMGSAPGRERFRGGGGGGARSVGRSHRY